MQYYKFPDYRHLNDAKFLGRVGGSKFNDFDVCAADSQQIISVHRENGANQPIVITLSQFIESNSNGDMSIQELISSEVNLNYNLIAEREKSHTVKIIKYLNGKPDTIAIVCENITDQARIIFFSVNGSENAGDSYIRQIDFEFVETGSTPRHLFVDTSNDLLYISYNNKIVVLDISDTLNISKISEYIIDDQVRLNNITYFTVEPSTNLVYCITNNLYERSDKIIILYYDKNTDSFTKRGEYVAPSADSVSYNTIAINGDYIYTNNINSLDVSNTDSKRSTVGLHILKGSNNFQTVSKIKSIPAGYYWNDSLVPLNKADIGYKNREQTVHYSIAGIKGNIMYVLLVPLINYVGDSGSVDRQCGDISSMLMYDISDPENLSIVGSNCIEFYRRTIISTAIGQPTFDDYKIYLLKENNENGEKIIIENGVGYVGAPAVSKIHLINTNAISLEQEITFSDNIPFDTDYYNEYNSDNFDRHGNILAIANGLSGVHFRYRSPITNRYEELNTIRPADPTTGDYDDIQKVLIYAPTIDIITAFCFGKKNIYAYKIDGASLAISTGRVYSMSSFEILGDVVENRFASIEGGDLYFFTSVEDPLVSPPPVSPPPSPPPAPVKTVAVFAPLTRTEFSDEWTIVTEPTTDPTPAIQGRITKTLIDPDAGTSADPSENMSIIGNKVSRPGNEDQPLGQYGGEFLLDKKPKTTNTNYINEYPNLVYGSFSYDVRDVNSPMYIPETILGEYDLNSTNSNRYYKCNISSRLVPSLNYGFETSSAVAFCPRLKSGLSVLDTRFNHPEFQLLNPTETSAIIENYIFGNSYSNNNESIISSAYHNNSHFLFLAVIDNSGNGRIVVMDARTFQFVKMHEISFPGYIDESTGQFVSDVDILFEVYIKSQSRAEDKLFVNIAGTSGKKAVQIYDISGLSQAVTPLPSPTPTPTITVTPSITPTIPLTPNPTPTISLTPSVTPTGLISQYRYTRKTLVLENLIPCHKYRLKLEAYSSQIGKIETQILDFDDLNQRQYDNEIVFESRNLQQYFRKTGNMAGSSLPIASDDKVYQSITYTLYHSILIDIALLKYTLTNLDTGKVIAETRIIKCNDLVECIDPRQECIAQEIKKIIQLPDGSIKIYVGLSPIPDFKSKEDLQNWINDNKCCDVEYSINNAEWLKMPESSIDNCIVSFNSNE